MSRRPLAFPVVLLLVAAAAGPVVAAEPAPPRNLTVALPLERATGLVERLDRGEEEPARVVGDALRPLVAASPAAPRLRAEIVPGSRYQILDWLSRGTVDVAVASRLIVHLLALDGVEVVELGAVGQQLSGPFGRPELPALSFERGPADPVSRRDRFDRFVDALLDEVIAGPCARLADADAPVLGDHLSSARFLVPVAEAHRRVERTLEAEVAEDRHGVVRERFWTRFFERVRLDVSGADPRFGLVAPRPEGCPEQDGVPALCFGLPVGDVLVVRRQVVDELLAPQARRGGRGASSLRAPPSLPAELSTLFGDGEEAPVPAPFRPMVTAEPYFGTRTFAFRVEETIELLRIHGPLADRPKLALVLPGGGVKAAYQTGLVDRLYGDGLLANAGALGRGDEEEGVAGRDPMPVDSIIGTSGGALLSFFVARLGTEGPFHLSRVLWSKEPVPGAEEDAGRGSGRREARAEGPFLTASDVFGWTDLPRYVSIVTIYLVFVVFLALVSVPRTGWLAPEQPRSRGRRLARPLLLASLAALLFGTPLAVRFATGATSLEHVPEFEGLLYALLIGLVMYADQCLVTEPGVPTDEGTDEGRAVWAPPALLLIVGGVLALGPLVLRLVLPRIQGARLWLEEPVSAGAAYLLLGITAAGAVLSSVERRGEGDSVPPPAKVVWWLACFLVGTGIAVALFWWLVPVSWMRTLDRLPLLFVAVTLIPVAFGLSRVLARGEADHPGGRVRTTEDAWRSWRESRRGRSTLLVLAWLVGFDLTRPPAGAWEAIRGAGVAGLGTLAGMPSKIDTPRGGLLVCLGAILLGMGAFVAIRRRAGYRLDRADDFVDAVVFVVVGQVFMVYVGLLALAGLPPRTGTLFELTPELWTALLALSALSSLGVLAWARRPRGGRLAGQLCDALRFLCDRHPDAALVSRRFARLAVLAVVGLGWWNFVLAPALYGNRYALDYFDRAGARFREAYLATYPERRAAAESGRSAPAYELTARFLTPANALEADGTRFVLAVSADEPCPPVPSTPGATWHRFRVVHDPDAVVPGEAGCEDLRPPNPDDSDGAGVGEPGVSDLAEGGSGLGRLRDAVFASGSVFPVFPPRGVELEPGRKERLVDGGYSNNVPVEGAVALGAGQALVVYSSNPLPGRKTERDLASRPYGPLVDGLPRLLGFLYQRSQQIDRRSRTDLFVASLAPDPDPAWPLLTDFRAATVERMLAVAGDDFDRRIGRVESWGPPRPRASFVVDGKLR